MRALLSGTSAVAALLAFELYLRVVESQRNAGALSAALAEVQPESHAPDARLGNLVRLSANERIVYALQPNLRDRTFRRTHVNTDEHGFRVQPEVAQDDRPLTTIVGIGDSIMFGHGVEDHQTYLYRLQELLQQLFPDRRWRVINTAVPGYNTVMEVETLERKCMDLDPDLVILSIVGNDYAPPYFVRAEQDVWSLERSFLLERVRSRTRDDLLAPGDAWYETDGEGLQHVPAQYHQVFGRAAFAGALDRLNELARQNSFDVVCFTTYEWDLTFDMVELAKERGFTHLTLIDELRAWIMEELGREFEPDSYVKSQLALGSHNSHPSAMQHEMAAQRLLRDLTRLGLLPTR